MTTPIEHWTEANLGNLIGQPESSRLEFKSGELLAKPQGKWTESLSKEISAFANSEGGLLVVGVREDKGIAIALDGVHRGAVPTQQLHDILMGCISPALTGIRLKAIPLSGDLQERLCYVIYVPAGNTAYQANDKRYYGRSELSVLPLPDHEVRLRMQRGRTARAVLEVEPYHWMDPRADIQDMDDPPEPDAIPFNPELPDKLNQFFRFLVHNTGDLTIRAFSLEIAFDLGDRMLVALDGRVLDESSTLRGRFRSGSGQHLLPNERQSFPGGLWTLAGPGPGPQPAGVAQVHWTLYLDDAPPCVGTLDVAATLREAHAGADS